MTPQINDKIDEKPCGILTDGALEYDLEEQALGTIGGVFVASAEETFALDPDVHRNVNHWQTEGREHVIANIAAR